MKPTAGITRATALAIALSATMLAAGEPPRLCLNYEPAITRLSGTIRSEVFPGPPNYISVNQGDREEEAIFLRLPSPVCVNDDSERTDQLNVGETDVVEIQLVLPTSDLWSRARQEKGLVVATGRLFHAFSAHHHRPLLLLVETLEAYDDHHQ